MSKEPRLDNVPDSILPTEIAGFDSPAELALDMGWSWHQCADELGRRLNCATWDLAQNPWVDLQTGSRMWPVVPLEDAQILRQR